MTADIATIAWTLRDLYAATTPANGTFTVASSVFTELKADGRWTVDSQFSPGPDRRWGYNFSGTIAATSLASLFTVNSDNSVTPHKCQVSVTFTPASGQPFVAVYQFTPIPTW